MKAMGAIAGLLKNKERLREVGEAFKQRLGELHASGEAGGGAVRVEVSGEMQVMHVELAPALAGALASGGDARADAEAMIRDATNEALTRVRALVQEEASKVANEMGLPALPGLM